VDFVLRANYSEGQELERTVTEIIAKMIADDKLIALHKKQLKAVK
jgi:hypothetical protein